MSGLRSRQKGRREEQQLVLYLAKLGWKAERILRQYQEAGQADVKASKGDLAYTFEMKSRAGSFKQIYDLFFEERDHNLLLQFVLNGKAVAVTTDFPKLLSPDQFFTGILADNPKIRVYQRIVSLEGLKQSASFLVIRDNHKPRLFLRYW